MFATTLSTDRAKAAEKMDELAAQKPAWLLVYGVEDADWGRAVSELGARFPNLPVFGATSFQGVFLGRNFSRDLTVLAGSSDDVSATPCLKVASEATALEQSAAACKEIEARAGARPTTLLLHATPGFEERILAGVQRVWGKEVPVYGGSAADDSLLGKWRVFCGDHATNQGFLMIGLSGPRRPLGAFLGGYLPSSHSGTITAARGRSILEIDGRAAAVVYNEWTGGAIAEELSAGGNVLLKTNLLPLARVVGSSLGMPRRVLSHPQEVDASSRALKLFTNVEVGDVVTLMTSTKEPLIQRVGRVVQRARGSSSERPRGGLLIYCAGCLGLLLDQAERVGAEFAQAVGNAPVVGIATFGEQGTFFDKAESWHGNLMCSAVLF